jgi:hypothetical protein
MMIEVRTGLGGGQDPAAAVDSFGFEIIHTVRINWVSDGGFTMVGMVLCKQVLFMG